MEQRVTQAVPSLAAHPFKQLLDRGVRTTLNTDDPGVMDINLMDECRNVMSHLGLSLETLTQCNDWAREASFIPQARIEGVWDNPSS